MIAGLNMHNRIGLIRLDKISSRSPASLERGVDGWFWTTVRGKDLFRRHLTIFGGVDKGLG